MMLIIGSFNVMECLNFGCCSHENQLFQEQAGGNNMYLANTYKLD